MADKHANSHSGYSAFGAADHDSAPLDGAEAYGSFEVFYSNAFELESGDAFDGESYLPEGWYWWACFPGCLPDSEAHGPFNTSQDAFDDARDSSI